MVDRYTRKDALRCAERLAGVLNKDFGNCYREIDGEWKSQIGCWELDYNPTYGGGVIEEIVTKEGGVRQPFGYMRRSARELCDSVDFGITAIDLFGKEKGLF